MAELFAQGRTGASGGILARALANADGRTRMAAIAGKKLGNAVLRNRMKRRIRAAYRLQKESLPKGWDFAFVARRGLLEAEWLDVMRDLRTAAARAIDGRPTGRGPRQSGPRE